MKHYLIVGGGISSVMMYKALTDMGMACTIMTPAYELPNCSQSAGASIVPIQMKAKGIEIYDTEKYNFIIAQYRALEQQLKTTFLYKRPLLVFDKFKADSIQSHEFMSFPTAYFLDIRHLIATCHQQWSFLYEELDYSQLTCVDTGVEYKDNFYDGVIFCEGVKVRNNPFFQVLKFNTNWGLALILEVEDLSSDCMYHHHHRLLPIENNQWWYGAAHKWSEPHPDEVQVWIEDQLSYLKDWLSMPVKVKNVIVKERPTTPGQFPYIGTHPQYPQLHIMNGLGSRGMMHSAYHAQDLAISIINQSDMKTYDQKKFQSFFR